MSPSKVSAFPPFLKGSHPTLPGLFSPVKVGDMTLFHRVVMGPMTRSRAPGSFANEQQALYYYQRATPGGLLISEGTPPSVTGHGYDDVPSLITEEHALAWRKSTSAVHDVGGYIYAQLWHVGATSNPKYQPNGAAPPSASEIPLISSKADGLKTRALTIPEIKSIVQEYKTSADLAINTAGFDGVEIHGAHGYLIDQFLHSSTNFRMDEYGGSIENRARFVLEIVEAIVEAVPASKVAIRLSPGLGIHRMQDDKYVELFSYVLQQLQKYDLAYIHLTEPGWGAGFSDAYANKEEAIKAGRAHLVFNDGGSAGTAGEAAIESGRAHLVGYAKPFIPNPDFVKRLWYGWPLTVADETQFFYGGDEKGYSDWPSYLESEAAKAFKSQAE
ncbi:NADH:flavin oxidoreductase/NADH oxidase [Cladochytrium replicatum]|nr:NADH:flavin oxidoreductase/NADH oxidase [Cladochytrium replicatum]